MLVAVPAGVAIGLVMGLVGAGGSILAVPVLVYLLGESPHAATTGALVVVLATSTAGAIARARGGERPRLPLAFGFATAAWPAALVGTAVNRALPDRALLGGFAVVLLVAAVATTRVRPVPRPAGRSRGDAVRLILAGLGVGALTGVFGVGGGFLIVPALIVALGLPTAEAMSTSLVVIALTSAVALLAHGGGGGDVPDWSAVLPLAAIAALGATIGAHVAGRIAPEALRTAFAALVVCVACALAASAIVPSF